MQFKQLIKFVPYLLVLGLMLLPELGLAQCPMCKGAAEQSIREGSGAANGLNAGIMYLFIPPYIIICTIAYLFWRANKKAKKESLV